MKFVFKHDLNKKCTTLKMFKGNFNLVSYLQTRGGNSERGSYFLKEIESNLGSYSAGEGAKLISITKSVMDYYVTAKQKIFPKSNNRKIHEKYVVTSKSGKYLDTFYFRQVK